jgi:2'-5' RNA ligase
MKINIMSPWQFKRSQSVSEKKKDQTYSYGCVMGVFNTPVGKDNTEDEDLFDNEEKEYGREIEPHVTVLYGLLDDEIEEDEVVTLLSMIQCPTVKCTEISIFENKEYDVLKWDVESDELNILNKVFTCMFPYESNYPDYHAHSTIAYLKSGKGKKYTDKPEEPIEKKIDYWVYSKADGTKIKIVPGEKNAENVSERLLLSKMRMEMILMSAIRTITGKHKNQSPETAQMYQEIESAFEEILRKYDIAIR